MPTRLIQRALTLEVLTLGISSAAINLSMGALRTDLGTQQASKKTRKQRNIEASIDVLPLPSHP